MPSEPIHFGHPLSSILDQWVALGWLRPLDRAFVHFLHHQDPRAQETVLLSAALASHQLGRGHTCLDLKATLRSPKEILSIPSEGSSGEWPAPEPSDILKNISLKQWMKSLSDSSLVAEGPGNTPLVLEEKRLYLRRFWQTTRDVVQEIARLLSTPRQPPSNLIDIIDRHFGSLRTPEEQKREDVHWQSVAAAISANSAFSIISGGPGTGKTTTVVHLLALLQDIALDRGEKMRIHLAAPTGKAAVRLTESIGDVVGTLPKRLRSSIPMEVVTLHRLLGSRPNARRFTFNETNKLHTDLLVIDEASMVDLEMMAAVLSALPQKACLVLLGDKDQLASVEAGSVLGDLCRHWSPQGYPEETAAWVRQQTGYAVAGGYGPFTPLAAHITVLQKSHRFGEDSGIGALARTVNKGLAEPVETVWKRGFSDIKRIELPGTDHRRFANLVLGSRDDDKRSAGYRLYLQRLREGHPGARDEEPWLKRILADYNRFRVLSPLRKGPWGVEALNHQTAAVLHRQGLIQASDGWYAGRPVIMTRNDYSLGLMNGDTGLLLPVIDPDDPGNTIERVVFPLPDGSLKKVLPSRLDQVETVYAMTVHKAQGSEFDHTVLTLPDRMSSLLTRELLYTAVTRARSRFTLVGPRLDLMAQCVKRRVYRASGLNASSYLPTLHRRTECLT